MNKQQASTAAYPNSVQAGYGTASSAVSWQQQQTSMAQQSSYGPSSNAHARQSSAPRPHGHSSDKSAPFQPSAQPPAGPADYAYGQPAQAPGPYGYGGQPYHMDQQLASQQQQQQQHQAAQSGAGPAGPPPPAAPPLPPRVPLADRDIFMLSLPSQDKRVYYDPESGSSDEDRDTDDIDSIFATSSLARATTNRGHKLSRSAPHIRRGRLGAYPHTDAGFEPTASTKRRKLLSGLPPSSAPGALAVAPNLHLLPRGAQPVPPPAVLPPVPQSPLDLLLTPGLQYTLGPKNQTFKTLGMSATGLIEQEGPLIGSLARVCAGLRGEGFEFRWEGDEGLKRKREEERVQEDEKDRVEKERKKAVEEERRRVKEAEQREAQRIRLEQERQQTEERQEKERLEEAERKKIEEEKQKVEKERKEAEREAKRLEEERVKDEEEAKLKAEQVEMANMQDAATAQVEREIPNPTANAATINATEGENASTALAAEVQGPAAAIAALPADVALPPLPGANGDAMEVDATPLPVVDLGALPPLPDMNGATNQTEAEDAAMAAALAAEDEDGIATRRRSGRVANRGPTNVAEYDEEEDAVEEEIATPAATISAGRANGTTTAADVPTTTDGPPSEEAKVMEEELPEYAKRLVDPELYVRSLFVSAESVEMPITRPGMAGQPAVTTMELVSPNDQEVLMHDCLTDLHRFLADSLEYRDRLAEIRDGVLGVERRRKGMWKVVRTVAEDWLREETEAQQNEG